ncbi:hypothetical protein HYU92_00810 [Candidatus Curtissbacteria bacterium]|nr:hypothetical protein [Candidatus Curtissbacteria bacterium]
MISYQKKQFELFEKLEGKFKQGKIPTTIVEPVADYANDNRIGLTSVIFIPENLQKIIVSKIIEPLREADSNQYFYLPRSLHLTIQNIRTISDPPLFTDEDVEKAKTAFDQIIPKHKELEFTVKGLFELPTSLGIRCYSNDSLKDLVLDLRKNLIKASVPDNKSYESDEIFFGNITVCRYITHPSNLFLEKIKKLKVVEVGKLSVRTICLITTNSVCHPSSTKIIGKYDLN